MSQEKSLPNPPNRPFGKKHFEQQDEQSGLLADRMAAAVAEGKLEEFIKQEMPDNEYVRTLAGMMMGMTGMMPMNPPGSSEPKAPEEKSGNVFSEVPEDVRKAIQDGDQDTLIKLLKREHQKRIPEAGQANPEEPNQPTAESALQPGIDKELVDGLIAISKENSVSVDWLIMRAIKMYIQEYGKTGKL
jgi:hypothetical protein